MRESWIDQAGAARSEAISARLGTYMSVSERALHLSLEPTGRVDPPPTTPPVTTRVWRL